MQRLELLQHITARFRLSAPDFTTIFPISKGEGLDGGGIYRIINFGHLFTEHIMPIFHQPNLAGYYEILGRDFMAGVYLITVLNPNSGSDFMTIVLPVRGGGGEIRIVNCCSV